MALPPKPCRRNASGWDLRSLAGLDRSLSSSGGGDTQLSTLLSQGIDGFHRMVLGRRLGTISFGRSINAAVEFSSNAQLATSASVLTAQNLAFLEDIDTMTERRDS